MHWSLLVTITITITTTITITKLTPFESSMPGSILKALVGKGKRAEPRAFCFSTMWIRIMKMVKIQRVVMMTTTLTTCMARSTDPSRAPFILTWRTKLACLKIGSFHHHHENHIKCSSSCYRSRMATTKGSLSSWLRAVTTLNNSVACARLRSVSWSASSAWSRW